ncbi:hypothetical protein AAKU55_000335 [Oxalobacteraceae bacterium GrIS 1.11]
MRLSWISDKKLFAPDIPARLDLRMAEIINQAIAMQDASGTHAAAAYLKRHEIPLTLTMRVLAQRRRRQPAPLFMFSRLRPRPPSSR